MDVYVTATLLIGLSVLLLLLSWSVIQQRRKAGVSLGDGDQLMMRRKIRAQGNLVEYGPMFVLLIAVAEINSGASVSLWAFASIFFVARLLHGIGMSFTQNAPMLRSAGMMLTLVAFLGAIGHNVIVLLGPLQRSAEAAPQVLNGSYGRARSVRWPFDLAVATNGR